MPLDLELGGGDRHILSRQFRSGPVGPVGSFFFVHPVPV